MSKRRRVLGQHFLNSQRFAHKISELAGVEGETVVEIGSGKGILTVQLASRASTVVAVEIDPRLAGVLRRLAIPNVRVINQDFLKIDLDDYGCPVVVGNIPYSVTSAIFAKLVADKSRLKKAVLCVQKEYGQKLMANVGDHDYGYITVLANHHFQVNKEFVVPARFFSPRPKVSSVVISFMPRKNDLDEGYEKELFSFIAGVFRYRRKSVKNAVLSYSRRSPQDLDDVLLRKRPQYLTFEDFHRVYANLLDRS